MTKSKGNLDNNSLFDYNFYINEYRDGEVRYHTCMSCREGIPSLKDIEFNVDIPFVMMDRYGDGLAKNLMGFGDPARDVEDCESK